MQIAIKSNLAWKPIKTTKQPKDQYCPPISLAVINSFRSDSCQAAVAHIIFITIFIKERLAIGLMFTLHTKPQSLL